MINKPHRDTRGGDHREVSIKIENVAVDMPHDVLTKLAEEAGGGLGTY